MESILEYINEGQDVYAVHTNGKREPLDPRLDLRNHSPTGFAWGYGGSGPAQLALAILAHFTGDDGFALKHYQEFKWSHIAQSPPKFRLSAEEIRIFIEERKREVLC